MKSSRDYLQGRSLEEVEAAAKAYEASHTPFDKRPLRERVQPPRAMLEKPRIALYLERIGVSFDGFKALNDLTFYVDEGELRCVIGPNGAGTAWFGRDCNLLQMDEVAIAQAGIGRKFQKPSVFAALTVAQNLELALAGRKTVWGAFRARLNGEQRDSLEEVLTRIRLAEQARMPAGSLSHGQKQWLEIGMLLMQKPRLLLLDEPVAGMTPEEMDRTIELLHELEGKQSIMVVEHDMEFVRAIAHKVTVLHQGSVLAEGSMEAMQNHPAVVEAYLGEPLE